MNDITAFDIYNYLPQKIQELLFNQTVDDLMENIFSVINIPTDKQVLLHRDTVSVLIGKYDIKEYENILKVNYGLNNTMLSTIMNILKTKLFDKVSNDIEKSKVIFKQAQAGELFDNKNEEAKTTIQSPEQLVSYIKNLAISLEKKEQPKDNTQSIVKNIEAPKIVEINKSNESIEDNIKNNEKVENKQVVEEKNSILLKAMKQRETNYESKLTEYYKALKDNLDNKVEEKENVFQPPFRATKGRGALIESSIDTENTNKISDIKEQKEEVIKNPVKYNSFNYIKKDKEENAPKSDDKFIDLGDF